MTKGISSAVLSLMFVWMVTSSAQAAEPPRSDIIIADFDGPTWGDWKGTGEAFGPGTGPVHLPRYQGDIGYLGTGYVTTFVENYPGQPNRFDKATGTLTSPPFKIHRHYLSLLFGGGVTKSTKNRKTCVNLLLGGTTHELAAGGPLGWHNCDVSAYDGQMAQIEIVDSAKDARLAADAFRQTDTEVTTQTTRTFVIDGAYLNMPVKHGLPNHFMRLEVDGKKVMAWSIELARNLKEVDFWAFVDVERYRGKTATVSIPANEPGNQGMAMLSVSNELVGAEQLYKEPWRPTLHFTAQRGWLNDPNGLFYYEGEWHLFYQWGPTANPFNNIFWGHAVSRDLVRWKHLPAAIYPGEISKGSCWSGTAWVDNENVTGFGRNGAAPLCVFWTDLGAGIAMGYSTDRGRTWLPYDRNPVFKSPRDPSICWVPELKKYVALTYQTAQFESTNLKDWQPTELGFPGRGECPDLFPLCVDGDPGKKRWVLNSTIGEFINGRFVCDPKEARDPYRGDFSGLTARGRFYAAQTFRNAPNNRIVQIAWLRGMKHMVRPDLPEAWCYQMLSLPYDLTLRKTPQGVRLFRYPVPELASLRGTMLSCLENVILKQGENPLAGVRGKSFDVEVEFEIPAVLDASHEFGLNVRGVPIEYIGENGGFGRDGRYTVKILGPTLKIKVVVDNRMMEVFMQDGLHQFTELPNPDSQSLAVFTKGKPIKVKSLVVYEMKSMWDQ